MSELKSRSDEGNTVPRQRSRFWCFTSWDEKIEYSGAVDYIIYQREVAPETKKEHWQGYIELPNPIGIKSLKNYFNSKTIHVEERRGSREQAREYCRKETSRLNGSTVIERGTWREARQGRRSDLGDLFEIIRANGSDRELAERSPGSFIRYGRGLANLRRVLMPERDWMPEVTICQGPTGSGKSKYAKENFPGAYYKTLAKWWDGYIGQENVIIDEFSLADWSRRELLSLLDRYPFLVETKGGTVQFLAKKICITTNEKFADWITHIPELERRVKTVLVFQ